MTLIEAAKLAKELDGVIADVEEGDGFDDVCLDTVKYVRDQLAASPKREWRGLTDAEGNNLWREVVGWGDPSHDDEDLMKAIEAKLKEKNA